MGMRYEFLVIDQFKIDAASEHMTFPFLFLANRFFVLPDCEFHLLVMWLYFYRVVLYCWHDLAWIVEIHHCAHLIICRCAFLPLAQHHCVLSFCIGERFSIAVVETCVVKFLLPFPQFVYHGVCFVYFFVLCLEMPGSVICWKLVNGTEIVWLLRFT